VLKGPRVSESMRADSIMVAALSVVKTSAAASCPV
jgi:hypothetical protein